MSGNSSNRSRSLQSLEPRKSVARDSGDESHEHSEEYHKRSRKYGGWLGTLVLWFLVFAVLFWILIFSFAPGFVLNDNGQINTGKVMLSAVIAALILIIIVWIIKALCMGKW